MLNDAITIVNNCGLRLWHTEDDEGIGMDLKKTDLPDTFKNQIKNKLKSEIKENAAKLDT